MRKARWALYLTTCGAALVLSSCIAADKGHSGSVRPPDARHYAGETPENATADEFAGGFSAQSDAGDFALAASSTNWLPTETDVLTHGSAGVTGGHALAGTRANTDLLDRWTRSSFRQSRWSRIRDAYEEPTLDAAERHSWSIDVDGDAASMDQPVSRPPGGNLEQSFAFTGKGTFADGFNVAVKGESVEIADVGAEEIGGFWLDRSDKWKKGTNSDLQVSLGVLEDRLRFTTRHGFSRYEDHDMAGEDAGNAIMQRVEADLLKTDDFRVGFFGSYARTDDEYTSLEDMLDDKDVKRRLKERDKQGEFADAGRERTKFGGTLGYGPVDLTLASVTESVFAGKNEGDLETGYEARLLLDVKELRGSLGGSNDGFWVVAPRWLWAGYEIRDVDVAGSSVEDKTNYASIGAAWNWKGAYLNVDYWRFFLDNRQPGAEDSDWLGDGLDVSVGYYEPKWGVYAGYSRTRANSYGSWSATEIGHNGWLSFSLKPEDLPDFKATASAYLYGADYPASASDYQDWTLSAELDFSKYLVESPFYDTSLKMVVQLDRDRFDYTWSGPGTTRDESDFFVGLRYDLTPK